MKRDVQIAAILYLVCTAVYAVTAWDRLLRPSSDTHFVWMAESFLARRLDLLRAPPHSNDWAEVEYLTLKDGTKVAGAFQRQVSGRFRTLAGKYLNISDAQIEKRERKHYVSFPPMPAILMLPFVALFKLRTNDVVFTVVLAGLVPALSFLLIRRYGGRDRAPPVGSALWLTLLLSFGSVFYFCSVIGQVWFTAHVVSLVFCGLFLLFALADGVRFAPLCGALLGGLFLTRPHMAAVGVVLLFSAIRKGGPRAALSPVVQSGLAFLPFFVLGCALNYARFGKVFEFGHSYLTTMQADNIQRFGLLNYQYLSRNLAAAFILLPKLLANPPYVQVSWHGLSLLCTTPALGYLLWKEVQQAKPVAQPEGTWARRCSIERSLWLTVIPVSLFSFLYQNDGYIQFGYRFSLDYMLPLVLLLALRNPSAPQTWRFRSLVLVGVAVNLFGAVTFGRMWQFYWNGFFPVS